MVGWLEWLFRAIKGGEDIALEERQRDHNAIGEQEAASESTAEKKEQVDDATGEDASVEDLQKTTRYRGKE